MLEKLSWKEVCLTACLFLFLFYGCQLKNEGKKLQMQLVNTSLSPQQALEEMYKANLSELISHLELLAAELQNQEKAEAQYRIARNSFKQLEPLLWAADKQNYLTLNGPNLTKVEEEDATDIKVKEPIGFQRLEEELFADEPDTAAIGYTLNQTLNRLRLLQQNAYLKLEERHVLWLLRDAVIRIATTGITGFDSPVLENSLPESAIVYGRLGEILALYQANFTEPELYQAWQLSIENSQKMLLATDFENFDRFSFIGEHSHTQMLLWTETVDDWRVDFPFEQAISHGATTLFSPETSNLAYFTDSKEEASAATVQLGKMLFNDASLSAKGNMSCATCHASDKAFTDGLKVFPGQFRNTPTLLYSGLQKGFFYDKRAGSLEGQISHVIRSEREFHTQNDSLSAKIRKRQQYSAAFDRLYAGKVDEVSVRHAIASYVRSLSPFNSRFDRSIRGEEQSLTSEEIKGFNLFTGKAKCATCHFAPTFNGTVPPNFAESELEMLGVPHSPENPTKLDTDMGRYAVFKTEERRHFFKTPTVRNANRTAPYMHNGLYKTLEEVLEFYNNGGGAGLGLNSPNQTLPADSLHLNKAEIQAIISFIKSLDDDNLEDVVL